MKRASPPVLIGRRRALALGVGLVASPFVLRSGALAAGDPFTLGVASGDPAPDGFVIWTRLATNPIALDGKGGMTDPVPVRWEVASDAGMSAVVASGSVQADERLGHSVHVEVSGLAPNRSYFYRFSAMGAQSETGRTRTMPARGARADHLRIGVANCSHWESGFFSAYRHLAAENPDLVLFLGDYIYEYSYTGDRAANLVRQHERPQTIYNIAGYRTRYALHRTDRDLQALHAAAPCLVTWDDHEVDNDYAADWSRYGDTPPEQFAQRRVEAYQAFYENMPVRRRMAPVSGHSQLFARFGYGDLAEINMADSRQYRTKQPCPIPDRSKPEVEYRGAHVAPLSCADLADPARTMLGQRQEQWLYDGFKSSSARWNLVAQGTLIANYVQNDANGMSGAFTDGWSGYQGNRERIMQAISSSKVSNPVFLSGDMHAFVCADLKLKPLDPTSATVATEFLGTSITSDSAPAVLLATLHLNPHVKLMDISKRGYMIADLTRERMDMRFQAISERRDPKATVSTLKRFVVEAGKPGAIEA